MSSCIRSVVKAILRKNICIRIRKTIPKKGIRTCINRNEKPEIKAFSNFLHSTNFLVSFTRLAKCSHKSA